MAAGQWASPERVLRTSLLVAATLLTSSVVLWALPFAAAAQRHLDVPVLLGILCFVVAVAHLACEHRWLNRATAVLDLVAGLLAMTALAVASARAGADLPVTAQVSLLGQVAGTLTGFFTLSCLLSVVRGPGWRDRRVVLVALAGTLVSVAAASGLVRPHLLPGPAAGVLLALAAAAMVAAAVARAPRPVPAPAFSSWVEHVAALSCGGHAVAVLMLDRWWPVPDVAVAAALVSLVMAVIRTAVLISVVGSLEGHRQAASLDDLTGLANRTAVTARTDALLARGGPVAVAVVSLDGFRRVNDALGRATGDRLLRSVAHRLGERMPAGSLLGRTGGDEFCVVLHAEVAASVDEVMGALAALLDEPVDVGGRPLHVTACVGAVADSSPCPALAAAPAASGPARVSGAELLRRAEAAVHAAKQGHDRAADGTGVVLWDPAVHDGSLERIELADDLHRALDHDGLSLHFQPQVSVATGVVVGVEALVRWQHPLRGAVRPDVFLPVAAETGQMPRLTAWVLREAVTRAAQWRAAGHAVPVSVNLSAADLHDGLVDRVATALHACGLPPSLLVLEITETSIVEEPFRVVEVLSALAELGVRTSIDDYGTGYSSLTLLLQLPVHELKIDRSFVVGLGEDPRSEVVVATTVELAHRLGMHVVAEGVETPEVLAHLQRLGCDVSQGWLHARALPSADLLAWLERRAQPDVEPSLPA